MNGNEIINFSIVGIILLLILFIFLMMIKTMLKRISIKFKSLLNPEFLLKLGIKFYLKKKNLLTKRLILKEVKYNGTDYIFYDYDPIIKDLTFLNDELSNIKLKKSVEVNNEKYNEILLSDTPEIGVMIKYLQEKLKLINECKTTHKNPNRIYFDSFSLMQEENDNEDEMLSLVPNSTLYYINKESVIGAVYDKRFIIDKNKNVIEYEYNLYINRVNILVDSINYRIKSIYIFGNDKNMLLPKI